MVLCVYMKVRVLYIALYMALNFSIYVHIYMDFRYIFSKKYCPKFQGLYPRLCSL